MSEGLGFELQLYLIVGVGSAIQLGTLRLPERYVGGDICFGGQCYLVTSHDRQGTRDVVLLVPAVDEAASDS